MPSVPLHHEIEPLRELVELPDITADNLSAVRDNMSTPQVELSDLVDRVDHVISDDPHLIVRVHTPDGVEAPMPCLYRIHGGGYVAGDSERDDARLDAWCQQFGMVAVAVEYRLAPETPYPGPLEDCYAGLAWTYEHATELGVDPERIGINGTSAGGGLCAGLALLARDRAEIPVQFQLLDCPMIDPTQTTPSSQLDDLIVWSAASNEFGWRAYLGELYGSDHIPPYAAPALADDLSGLPEAYVCVGGADGFRDEDITYAMRLYGAGVPTELHVYPGAPHGVGFFAGTGISARYLDDQTDWLARQLARLAADGHDVSRSAG